MFVNPLRHILKNLSAEHRKYRNEFSRTVKIKAIAAVSVELPSLWKGPTVCHNATFAFFDTWWLVVNSCCRDNVGDDRPHNIVEQIIYTYTIKDRQFVFTTYYIIPNEILVTVVHVLIFERTYLLSKWTRFLLIVHLTRTTNHFKYHYTSQSSST